MFLLAFLASDVVDGHLPGGAGANDPVPASIEHYTTPMGYGLFAFVVLAALLFVTTRFKVDR